MLWVSFLLNTEVVKGHLDLYNFEGTGKHSEKKGEGSRAQGKSGQKKEINKTKYFLNILREKKKKYTEGHSEEQEQCQT